jgi:hypothetical protein
MYSFVLTLWCLTCVPQQVIKIDNIDISFESTTFMRGFNCRELGEILSGDYARLNAATNKPAINELTKKDLIVYSCTEESDEF